MYNLVIVDDEPKIINGLSKIVDWESYNINIYATAQNGIDALDKINDEVDIVITDINMPQMNGIELIKTLREKYSDIKIVILSAYDDFEYLKAGIVYSVNNYILKPIDKGELCETIETITNELDGGGGLKVGEEFLDHLFNGWVTGSLSPESLRQKCEVAGIALNSLYYQPAVIMIKNFTMQDDVVLRLTKLLNAVKKQLLLVEDLKNSYSFVNNSGNITLILHRDRLNSMQTEIKTHLAGITKHIEKETGESLFCIVGEVCNRYSMLAKSYSDMALNIYVSVDCRSGNDADEARIVLISRMKKEDKPEQVKNNEEKQIKPVIGYICKYIDENYMEYDLSVKKLSNKFRMSTSYLGQLFKIEKGELFNDYLNKVRMSNAKRLIEQTDMRITEIATAVGYSSVSYFEKIFRKHFNFSPTDYKLKFTLEGAE